MNSFFYLLKWSIRSLNVRVFLAQFYIFKIKLQPSSSLCFLRRLRRSIWCLLPSRQLKHAIISTMDSFFSLLRISHEEFNVCCVPALLKPSKTQLERFLLLSSQNPSTHRYVRVFLALFDISKSLTPGFMELPVLFESTISVYPKKITTDEPWRQLFFSPQRYPYNLPKNRGQGSCSVFFPKTL